MRLFELFDKPTNYKQSWVGDGIEATFKVGEQEYEVDILERSPGDHYMSFYHNGQVEDTGDSENSTMVFATVAKILEKYVEEHIIPNMKYEDQLLQFSSGNPKRYNLYQRFAKGIANRYNTVSNFTETPNGRMWHVLFSEE